MKKLRATWATSVAVVAIASLACGCAFGLANQQAGRVNLHHVKRVSIDSTSPYTLSAKAVDEKKRLELFLAEALTSRGFVVVETAAGADATIKIEKWEIITVDAPPPNPPQYPFTSDLISLTFGVNWPTSFTIYSRDKEQEVEQRAAERVAERLFQAWKEAAVHAGVLTRTQAKAFTRIDQDAR